MRKRNIKSIAHWSIMSVLLLFPVLMVGISAFANDEQTTTVSETYEYETNDVNDFSDIVIGNIYKFNGFVDTQDLDYFDFSALLIKGNISIQGTIDDFQPDGSTLESTNSFYVSSGLVGGSCGLIYCDYSDITSFTVDNAYIVFTYFSTSATNLNNFVSSSDYLGEITTTVDIQESNYKQEVNNWANGFKQLPVNSWYNSLLNAIGIGDTTNSVMNVIYVYPLYVLWVYILDLIVDCLLLIINFGHDALQRLGADNE